MKIVVDLRKLSYKPSGIGMYTYNFVAALIKQKNIDIIGVTDVQESFELLNLQTNGLKIIEYGKKVDKNLEVFSYFNFINDILADESPDVFWEPNQIISKNIKKKNPKIKIIITIHDIFPVTLPQYYSLKYRIYFKYFQRKTIKNADYIIYVSKFSKNETTKFFEEAKFKKSFISYNIINVPKYDFNVSDENFFLFIGNIERRKGIEILLNAYEMYLKKDGEKNLKILGNLRDNTIKDRIDNLKDKYPLRVEYIGYADDETKWKLLSKCSALIFPSFAEGFGIPPIEALLLGKTVIASDLEIFREICGDFCTYFDIISSNNVNDLCDIILNIKSKKNNYSNLYTEEILINSMMEFLNEIKR